MFIEAVLWIVRIALRDLPEIFGSWNSAFRRFNRWSAKGIWQRIFAEMAEYLIIDSTIVRAHQHAAETKRTEDQAIGRSRGGLSRNPLAIRGLGCPIRILPTVGQRGDVTQAAALLTDDGSDVVLADAAYDADHFRACIASVSVVAAIFNSPSRSTKQGTSLGRVLLSPAQAVPPRRYTIRKNRLQLPRRRHPRRSPPLDQVTVHTA